MRNETEKLIFFGRFIAFCKFSVTVFDMWVHLTEYEHWVIDMELQGKEVPCPGDVIYVPYDDDVGCFCETWEGNLDQREYVEQGVCFPTANEAVAKAREDLEASLGHVR